MQKWDYSVLDLFEMRAEHLLQQQTRVWVDIFGTLIQLPEGHDSKHYSEWNHSS